MTNPFILSALIPDEYFCDREKETERLISYLINNNNVTLISPRRMGKSGLINHSFNQPVVRDNYATLYIDILQTSSLREFVYVFGKAVYEHIVPKTTKWITLFFQTLKSLYGKISFDPISGFPSFNMMLGDIKNPLYTLDELFSFIINYEKKCIIAIDEFQQITKYPEKNVEAILRSHIQQQNHATFVFSGSIQHIMTEMFASHSRPFFQSTSLLELKAIPEKIYKEFVKFQFERADKGIEEEAIEKLYRQFDGYTFYLQKVLNEAFTQTLKKDICKVENLQKIIIEILESNSVKYRELLSNIPDRQKDLLYAIAIAGEAQNITSTQFINTYSLSSSSSVQSAAKVLLEKEYITKLEGKYFLTDKFFSLWIKSIYGPSPFLLLEE